MLSSIYNSPFNIVASAGTLSPLSRYTISPTTNSSILIVSLFEFLSTLTFIIEFSSFNFSKAFSLPYSDKLEIIVAKKIAINIPTVS